MEENMVVNIEKVQDKHINTIQNTHNIDSHRQLLYNMSRL